MKQLIIGILALTLVSAAVSNATPFSLNNINSDLPDGPGASTPPWSLDVDLTLDLTQPGGGNAFALANWSFTLTSSVLGPFMTVLIEGFHQAAPHPGETFPSHPFVGAVLFPSVAGSGGIAFGSVPHNPNQLTGHADDWRLEALVLGGGTTASIKVQAFHAPASIAVPDGGSACLLLSSALTGLALLKRKKLSWPLD